MAKETTVGKILLNLHVPANLKPFVADTVLDKKGIGQLFSKLAEGDSAQYRDYVTSLTRLGFEASTRQGSTVPLEDLSPLDDKEEQFEKLDKTLAKIKAAPGTKKEKDQKALQAYSDFTTSFEKSLSDVGTKKNHTLAKVLKAGARGSMSQYRQTVGATILVNDEKGRPMLDFPIKHSFAEGLTIPEYLAHSYGTRQGAIATKLAIADSGYFSKQLSRSSMPIKIEEHDCGTDNGIPVSVEDKESIGAFLAHPAGTFKKNNEITGSMLATLADKGIKEIIVRSPITCQSSRRHHNWAVCQLCAGRREKGTLPELDSYLGITAGAAAGEPLSQGQLNTKHTASAATIGKNVASGFKLVEQLSNPAQNFQNRAGVADIDGTVTVIKAAPQGGFYVTIKGDKKEVVEYIPSGFDVIVKLGSKVEAGDVLSQGIVNIADIVKHKGIGEGRRYYTDTMHKAFADSGMGVNRRNFEVISKGAIDHVRITHPDGLGDYLPDAIVSYQGIEKNYKPRPSAKNLRIDQALGKYLEVPVLHLTIGTKLTSSMLELLKRHKIATVTVDDDPPPFESAMLRLLDVPGEVPDWAHQLNSSYLEKRLIKGVNEGISSNLKGPSPILGVSYGVGFGDKTAEYPETEEEID
jgi:DNA-directed RNA polymerase subunit beta'